MLENFQTLLKLANVLSVSCSELAFRHILERVALERGEAVEVVAMCNSFEYRLLLYELKHDG